MAIVAYNEPITRVQVDAIRGVGSTSIMRKLVAKGFIKEAGRSDMPGRPILYETTHEFLDYFGLSSIHDLPKIDDILKNVEENEDDGNKDLYTSRYTEVDEDE